MSQDPNALVSFSDGIREILGEQVRPLCLVREPVQGFFVIHDFANAMGIDANQVIPQLDSTVPSRGAGDTIVPGELQWVTGQHPDLQYRGRELRRRKIWAQNGPVRDGVLIYSYTGFTYPVAQATSDWDTSPLLADMSARLNGFLTAGGVRPMNHLIVTAYDDGSHNIGWHYDKVRSLEPEGWIAILKLGPASRRFALRKRAGEGENQETMPVLFDEVVPAGTLLLMSVATNLATQHAVPEERGDVGLSGSIVWRAIKTRLSQLELGQKITQTEKGRAVRQKRKREKALEAAGEGDGAQALRHSLRV